MGAAEQAAGQLPEGGKVSDPGAKGGSPTTYNQGNPSVPEQDNSGRATGSHAGLTRNLRVEPVITTVDATTPTPPGYGESVASPKQPNE